MRIRNELKKKTPKLILQYLPQEANGAKTKEFQSLWRSLPDKNAGDCLNISSLDNFGGGKSYNIVGERIVSVCFYPWTALSVLWNGRAVTCCMDYNGVQGRRRSELPEYKGNLEWACVVRDQKELWEARL